MSSENHEESGNGPQFSFASTNCMFDILGEVG